MNNQPETNQENLNRYIRGYKELVERHAKNREMEIGIGIGTIIGIGIGTGTGIGIGIGIGRIGKQKSELI